MQHKEKRLEYYKNPLRCDRCNSIIPFEKRLKKHQGINGVYCGNSCSVLSTNRFRFTDKIREKMRKGRKEQQAIYWTEEKRKEHSIKMRKAVNQNPDSYSKNNVCGRVKPIKIIDSFGNETKCLGRWELLVAEYLNTHNIKWTNKIDDIFEYQWNGSTHRYFPDFKLVGGNRYIEVKGFERERDRCKWSQFPYPLTIIKLDEIKRIKNGTFSLTL